MTRNVNGIKWNINGKEREKAAAIESGDTSRVLAKRINEGVQLSI